jgi:hypothetical protein
MISGFTGLHRIDDQESRGAIGDKRVGTGKGQPARVAGSQKLAHEHGCRRRGNVDNLQSARSARDKGARSRDGDLVRVTL